MALQEITFRLTGTRPLLMHNIRLANPMDPKTQELSEYTKKRNKTLADHKMIAQLEFVAGIYFDDKVGPYIPGNWFDKNIEEGGRGEKLGKTIRAAVRCKGEYVPLEYSGPRKLDALFKGAFYDQRAVGIGAKRTIRTRPYFDGWAATVIFAYDDEIVNGTAILRSMKRAGAMIGLGDYRPRYGLYDTEEVK